MLLRVDAYEIDTELFELRRNGERVPTEPLVFDLIRYLAENPGRLLSRSDLVESVWGGRIVSEATISSCIKAARQALGDSGTEQNFIRTVRGRGFQFVKDVEYEGPKQTNDMQDRVGQEKVVPPSSLVILPFDAFGDSESLTAIGDGLVENLTTILVRVPLLSIVSRSTSFSFKGKSPTASDVRSALGVSYMIEGSIQRVADTLRVNVQLIETAGGFHLWAQQFDVAEGPNVLDDLLQQIVPRVEAEIMRAMFDDLKSDDGELSARQLLLKATSLLAVKGWHRATFEEATKLLRASIAKDPEIALTHAQLAIMLGLGHRVGLLEKSIEIAKEAEVAAEKALELDNRDSISMALAGCALADIGQVKRAIPLLERAIDLNPNNGHAWAALGSAQLILDDVSPAIENLSHSLSISPMDARLSVWQSILAIAHFEARDMEAAEHNAREAGRADERNYMPRVVLAAILLSAKKNDEAATAMADAVRVKPDLSESEIAALAGRKIAAALYKHTDAT